MNQQLLKRLLQLLKKAIRLLQSACECLERLLYESSGQPDLPRSRRLQAWPKPTPLHSLQIIREANGKSKIFVNGKNVGNLSRQLTKLVIFAARGLEGEDGLVSLRPVEQAAAALKTSPHAIYNLVCRLRRKFAKNDVNPRVVQVTRSQQGKGAQLRLLALAQGIRLEQ